MVSQYFHYYSSDLSSESLQVFYYIAHGFSLELISDLMSVDIGELKNLIDVIETGYRANSLSHVIAIMISAGLISVSDVSLAAFSRLHEYLQSCDCECDSASSVAVDL